MDLPEGLTSPNDGAYEKTETRSGPPLDYVAEKLQSCLQTLHTLHRSASQDLPNDLPPPERFAKADMDYNPKTSSVLFPAQAAFYYALVSFLALNNLLAIANDPDLPDRLLTMSHDDFESWLERIISEGSVT